MPSTTPAICIRVRIISALATAAVARPTRSIDPVKKAADNAASLNANADASVVSVTPTAAPLVKPKVVASDLNIVMIPLIPDNIFDATKPPITANNASAAILAPPNPRSPINEINGSINIRNSDLTNIALTAS